MIGALNQRLDSALASSLHQRPGNFIDLLPLINSFTRASSAWTTDFRKVDNDVIRHDYDLDGKYLGRLITEDRTNLAPDASDATQWASRLNATQTDTGNTLTQEAVTFKKVAIESGGSTSDTYAFTDVFSSADGDTISVRALFQAGTSGKAVVLYRDSTNGNSSFVNGPIGSMSVGGTAAGAISNFLEYTETVGGETASVVEFTLTHSGGASSSAEMRFGPNSNTAGETVVALGAQYEDAPFPGPFIDTSGGAVTVAAEVAQITNVPWFNAEGVSLVFEYTLLHVTSDAQLLFNFNDGSGDNLISAIASRGSGQTGLIVNSGGVSQVNISGSTPTAGTAVKLALAASGDDFVLVQNGVVEASRNSGSMPIGIDAVNVGATVDGSAQYLNGHFKRALYSPARLSNAQLQELTG